MDTRLTTEGPTLQVCLAARDLSAFSLLVEDLHAELGENWGELTLNEASDFLDDTAASNMALLVVAVDEDDRDGLINVEKVIAKARRIGLATLLVAEDLTDLEIYQLTQCGATPHVEYPLQEGDLAIALGDLAPDVGASLVQKAAKGEVFAIQGIAGGAGSSTLAINLAREIAALDQGSVCLIDLDVQFGSVGMELGLPPSDAALDLLFDQEIIDPDWLNGSLARFGPNMKVLTSPADVIPLDSINPHGLTRLLALAQTEFDFVVVDMPKAISGWTNVAFDWADTVFCPVTAGKKSAAMIDRFRQTCLGEDLPLEKLQFIVNRMDSRASHTAQQELDRLSVAAGMPVEMTLPHGGDHVGESASFAPMSSVEPFNALGQEIHRMATMIADRRVMAA